MADGRSELKVIGGARVIAPAPLISLAAALAGLMLQSRWPLPTFLNSWTFAAGWALEILATAIILPSAYCFLRARTAINPYRSARNLVARGPYRYSRNPMYVSLVLYHAGYGLNNGNWWILLMLLPAVLLIHYGVIAREERYLEQKFGEDYRRYRDSVRRWI